jgi:uncharacterized protein
MTTHAQSTLAATDPDARQESLDALRGLALFGVLMVNLQTEFRVSLFTFYSVFHTHPGRINFATDQAIRFFLESKAFAIFSLLFGAGLAMFFERARRHGCGRVPALIFRRVAVLLVLGAAHLLFWNGDILFAYAVAGLLVWPVLFAGPRLAAILALACAAIACLPGPLPGLPDRAEMVRQGLAATPVYQAGTTRALFLFRWNETYRYILPLLLGSLPRIVGLMLAGTFAWRLGLLSPNPRRLKMYRVVALAGLLVGGSATAVEMLPVAACPRLAPVAPVAACLANIPFGLGYVALVLWAAAAGRWKRLWRLLAPAGRMALTNYLSQSMVLSFVFFSFGLGLFGQLSPAPVALGGITLYAIQLYASRQWLLRFRFGPFEWAWRSLTFGRGERLRRVPRQPS